MKISTIYKSELPTKSSQNDKYPFREMQIGDAITITIESSDELRAYDALRAYTYQWQKRHNVKFSTRTDSEANTMTVYRTK